MQLVSHLVQIAFSNLSLTMSYHVLPYLTPIESFPLHTVQMKVLPSSIYKFLKDAPIRGGAIDKIDQH